MHLASRKTALKIFMGKLLELVFCSSVTILCFHSRAFHVACPLLVLHARSFSSEAGGRGYPGAAQARSGAAEGGSPSPCPLRVLRAPGRAPRAPSSAAGAPSPGRAGSVAAVGGGSRPPPPPASRRAPALNAGRRGGTGAPAIPGSALGTRSRPPWSRLSAPPGSW